MFSATLSALVALSASLALAQDAPLPSLPPTPLAQKRFPTPSDLPYRVDTDTGLIRGEQFGYNICNATTAGQDSRCQTAYFNSIEDFCIWGPPEYGEEVGNIEGIMVAYCTQPRHGTRLIPAGALQGVQWMKTPSYVYVAGFIDQTAINILRVDSGGEMDPHGADLRGNPMGGVVYSDAFDGSAKQVIEWHNFIGNHHFCFKACDPADPDDDKYCEHIFDRIGCAYNVPNNAQNGTFESCEGDVQDFPGTYTGDNGQITTYTQPAGQILTMPYTARVPASSNCVQHTSSLLWPELPTVARPDAPTETPTPSDTTTSTGPGATAGNGNTGGNTGGNNNNGGNQSDNSEVDEEDGNGASAVAITALSALGVVFSALFFA